MNIFEAYPYIIGRKYSDMEEQSPIRCTQEMVARFQEEAKKSCTAGINLKSLDSSVEFYRCENELKKVIPKEEQEEVFYATKLEKFSPIIPSKYLYLLKMVKEQLGSFNLLTRGLSAKSLNTLFAKGTIAEGYCLKDVICSVFQKDYTPISDSTRGVQVEDYWEVATSDGKNILLLPDKLRKLLSDNDLELLEVKHKTVLINGQPLRFISNEYYGVYNKIYDMRELF